MNWFWYYIVQRANRRRIKKLDEDVSTIVTPRLADRPWDGHVSAAQMYERSEVLDPQQHPEAYVYAGPHPDSKEARQLARQSNAKSMKQILASLERSRIRVNPLAREVSERPLSEIG